MIAWEGGRAMAATGETLQRVQAILRLFEACTGGVCDSYGLSQAETGILMFLINNPGLDTASDIVRLRGMLKANVSKAVDALIRKGLLARAQDGEDRRRVHLYLTGQGRALIPALSAAMQAFTQKLFKGFTPEEAAQYERMNERIAQNALEGANGKEP